MHPATALQPRMQVETVRLFDSVFATRPAAEWEGRLRAEGVWFQPVVQLDEVLREPQVTVGNGR